MNPTARFRRTIVCLIVVVLGLSFGVPPAWGEPPKLESVPDGFTIVDLRPHVNMGWRDEVAGDGKGGWTDQGSNDMRNAPLGLRNLRGVPFRLIDPKANDGKAVLVLKSKNFRPGPEKVTVPLRGAKADRVYVLQAAAWLEKGAAKFTLVYQDDTRSKTLQAWENIRVCDWWSPSDSGKYKVAFLADNPERANVGMVAMEWKNPSPDKPLKSLLIESYNQQTVMIIGAVTLSRKGESAFDGDGPGRDPARSSDAKRGPARVSSASNGSARPTLGRRYRREQIGRYAKMLAGRSAVDAILSDLSDVDWQEQLDAKLAALCQAIADKKAYPQAGALHDRLVAKGDLPSAILAAEVFYKTVDALKTSSYGSTREAREFPDDLCARAVTLLDHDSPVVGGIAEWALALRVRKVDGGTRSISDMYQAAEDNPAWYRAWRARAAAGEVLTDDYVRQLAHLNRHRTVEGVGEAVEKTAARIERMLAAPGSASAGDAKRGYKEALVRARLAVRGGGLDRAHEAYLALRASARRVIVAARSEFPSEGLAFFTNPRIPGGVWNVNVPVTGRTNTPFGDIYRKAGAEPSDPVEAMIDKKALGDGAVRGMDLHWGADRLLFSYWHKPIRRGMPPFGWDPHKNAFLYELDLRTGKTSRLTASPGDNDIEPCFLPDGSYMFASDRSSFGNQCAGPFLQDKRCTTLYRLDPDRGEEPVAISNNKDFDRHPHVLNDGTVVFLHWEYQERNYLLGQNAWRCRPDGTNMDAFYKQHITRPYSIRDVQQAPDSDVCVATVQGHHDGHNGPVVVFRPALGINDIDHMKLVTVGCEDIEGGLGPVAGQIVPEGGVENRGGSYINPFPMSDKAFLVGLDLTDEEVDFALYYIDVWGNRELLHRDPDRSCFQPHPLRKRVTPPVVADTVNPDLTYATAFVENVYRDLPGVEKGAVKYLRMSQRLMVPAPVDYDSERFDFNHLHFLPGDSTARHFSYWTWAPTRTVGIVPVEPDGSAYFKVPAGTPVFLQALDENLCEIRRMRTSFTLQRGEFRSCTGCHETRHETVGTQPAYPRSTLEKGPKMPVVPPWGDRVALDYQRDIQPIFTKHCVSCHDQSKPAGGLELTARKIGGFNQSYRSLFGLKPTDPTIVKELDWHLRLHPDAKGDKFIDGRPAQKKIGQMQEGTWPGMLVSISDRHGDSSITMPYQFGTNKSKLIQVLLKSPKHVKVRKKMMDGDDWRTLVAWIDYNCLYHSTVIDKSKWTSGKTLKRVGIYVPSPWVPADTNPAFLNRTDSSYVPPAIEAKR